MVADRILRHLTVFGSQIPTYSRTYAGLGLATSLGYMFLIYVLLRAGARDVRRTHRRAARAALPNAR